MLNVFELIRNEQRTVGKGQNVAARVRTCEGGGQSDRNEKEHTAGLQ